MLCYSTKSERSLCTGNTMSIIVFNYNHYVECGTKISGILGFLHIDGLLSCSSFCEGESEIGVQGLQRRDL